MTMTSSLTTMFGRLPIYTRPKEPAIGYPVLTESTNTNLTGHILGLDGRPIPTPVIGGNLYDVGHKIASFKGLPDIPLMSSMHDEEDDFRPPPPLRVNTLAYPSTGSSSPASTKSQTSVDTMNTFRTPASQRGNIQRKPAPAPALANHPAFSANTKSSSETIRNHPAYTTPEPKRNSNRSRSFGLGSVVKEKVAARRKQPGASPTMDPLKASSPVAVVKPANFVSIDDWLDSREREGLHRRSNTVTTVASQATRYGESHKLHLRQSTFAPLPTSQELVSQSAPVLPPIPKQYARAVSKASTASPPPSQPLGTSSPPPPPRAPPMEEKVQRTHIEQLEYEQDQLVIRRGNIKREMWDLQQLLPPNPTTHNPAAKKDMEKRLEELVQELADVEKEVHENGMKLHRAWRRRDKQVGFEPTHLWVSRVSGSD